MDTIYLDAAATTKPKPEVINAIMPYLTGDKWYNPSSLYSVATKVKEDIENVRKTTADFIGANTSEVYFTSGASESNAWALQGFVNKVRQEDCHPVIITSQIEHKSIMSYVDSMRNSKDVAVVKITVDENGFVDLDELEDVLNYYNCLLFHRVLVSIGYANSEIGTIQNIKEISDMAHHYNAIFHTDATQAMQYIDVDVKAMGIDLLSASAQKFGGLKGTGFLYKSNDVDIAPLIYGSQEKNMRGGTSNVIGIIAMGEAIKHINHDNRLRIVYLRNVFVRNLEDIGCELVGDRYNRLPNNISVMLPEGIGGEEILYMLDMAGIIVSVGSACNSRSKQPSYVLKAIGLSDEEASRVIRLTFSSDLNVHDIKTVVNEIEKSIKVLSSDF